MRNLYFKACPKCRGDLQRVRDVYGEYLECLQCGLLMEAVEEEPEPAPPPANPAAA